MSTFKKSVIAVLTVSAIAVAAAGPAEAKKKHWHHGVGAGIGIGVGLGIAGAILTHRRPTYVVQSACYDRKEPLFNKYGDVVSYEYVRVCD